MAKYTREYIESLKTPAGGFTKATLASLGVAWPPPKGWRYKLEVYEPRKRHTIKDEDHPDLPGADSLNTAQVREINGRMRDIGMEKYIVLPEVF